MFSLIVLNKSRSEKDTFYYNVPTIFTDDEEMVTAIEQYKTNDIIEVEGVITTKNVIKASSCEHCGEKNIKEKAIIFVITPLYLCRRESGIQTREDALQKLQPHVEISNKCFALGTVLRNPELIAVGKKKEYGPLSDRHTTKIFHSGFSGSAQRLSMDKHDWTAG